MRPFSILIKPTGPDCNINCKYYYYSRKSSLFGKNAHRMSNDVLDKLVKDYLSLNLAVSSFAWQGGEPTLMGLDFYKRVHCCPNLYLNSVFARTNESFNLQILLDRFEKQFYLLTFLINRAC